MARKRSGLGRGLSALIPNANPSAAQVEQAAKQHRPANDAKTEENPETGSGSVEAINAAKFAQEVAQSVESGGRPADVFFASGGSQTPKGGSARELLMPRQRKSKQKTKVKSAPNSVELNDSPLKAKEDITLKPSSSSTIIKASSPGIADPNLREIPGVSFAVISVAKISANKAQPRTIFKEEELKELADSIKQVGLLQPIVVRELGRGYELVMGERRLRACKLAGISEVPAIIRGVADNEMLREALLENLHRVELSPLDEAAAYQQLMSDFGCTQAELSQRVARSRSQIANMLRLLRLPAVVQAELNEGRISTGHARALLGLKNLAEQERVCARVIREELSVRELERIVAKINEPSLEVKVKTEMSTLALPVRYQQQADAWSAKWADSFTAKVQVKAGKKKGSGKIVIDFADEKTLEQITQLLFNS